MEMAAPSGLRIASSASGMPCRRDDNRQTAAGILQRHQKRGVLRAVIRIEEDDPVGKSFTSGIEQNAADGWMKILTARPTGAFHNVTTDPRLSI
jgi:hypothetical protein